MYDADGQGGWTWRQTRTFAYDGWNVMAEYLTDAEHSTATLARTYAWGPSLGGGIGGLLSVTDHLATPGPATYVPVFDGNGNVLALTDTLGQVVASYQYDPYGKLISASDASTTWQADATGVLSAPAGSVVLVDPFLFSTKYCDFETGLYDFGMRYYAPDLQRWINRDPIEESGGVNLYAYCGSDPVNKVDPTGMDDQPLFAEPIDRRLRLKEPGWMTISRSRSHPFALTDSGLLVSSPTTAIQRINTQASVTGLSVGLMLTHPEWGDFLTRRQGYGRPLVEGFSLADPRGPARPGLHATGTRGPYISVSTNFLGAKTKSATGVIRYRGRLYYIDMSRYDGNLIRKPQLLSDMQSLIDNGLLSEKRLFIWQRNQVHENEVLLDKAVKPFAVRRPVSVYLQRGVNGASRVMTLYALYETGKDLSISGYHSYQQGTPEPFVHTAVDQAGGWAGAIAGGKVGATVGSAGGPVGAFIGGVIGGVAGYAGGHEVADTTYNTVKYWPEVRSRLHPGVGSPASFMPYVKRDMFEIHDDDERRFGRRR